MAQQAPQAGRVLNGRYRLEEKLGEGGMGQIWRAEHLILKAPVAVKLVDREAIPDDETLSRFIREAQAAAAIRSPHVVQILDYGTDGQVPFMVMELLDGETLAQRLKREKRVSAAETARIITHIARAVGRAHEEGIVHRDLKPENVFLVKNDDEEVAKVLDFGVAKMENANFGSEGTRTRTGSILGTPFYMSPEQAQGNKTVDYRSDLWSMAVIAFECLTGVRPFYSDGLGDLVLQICIRDIPVPSRIAPVPLGFDAWFKKGTQREPDQRFQSARELVESLRDVLGLEPRETWAGPDVLVTTGGASEVPPSRQPLSRSEALTELATTGQLGVKRPSEPRDSLPATEREPEPPQLAAPEAEARPPSVSSLQLEQERAPALTVQQFGTTKLSTPPPTKRSSAGVVWGVAGGALAIGAMIGFAVVSRGEESGRADPVVPSEHRLNAAPPATATTEVRRTDSIEPTGIGDIDSAAVPAPSASVEAQPEAGDEGFEGDREQPEPDDAGAPVDAGAPGSDATPDGWVKPEWARPDDEESFTAPLDPPPKATGEDDPKDNPYN